MHGSNGNGASVGRLEDSTPNSRTQLITSASPGNSTTPNPNQLGARNRTQSQLENALFTNTTHNEQDYSRIANIESQSLRPNLVDSHVEEPIPNAQGVKTQSSSFDSQMAAKIQGARGGEHSESGAAIKESFTMNPYARSKSRMQLRKAMFVRYINLYYKKWIIDGLLRRRELSPTKDGRHIILDASRGTPLIDERTGKGYINNSVRSSRYTIWTFIPGQLWFQFSKLANVYFLVMGILQLIPGLSTTGTYTTILPLLVFLVLTIAREGYDDFQRYRLDRVENRRMVRVLYGFKPGGIEGQRDHSLQYKFKEAMERSWTGFRTKVKTDRGKGSIDTFSLPSESDDCDSLESDLWGIVKWTDVKVGDIIMLKRNEQVPADIVLLHAEGRDSIAYVETMALDGETNLKNRQPPRLLQCRSTSEISNCHAHFVVEDPNLDLYDFNGKVSVDGTTLPLTLDNVIYRGSTLRNTARAIGMVINTGEECKIRMNASKNPHTKAPAIQSITNKVVILLAVFVVLLAIGCTAGYQIWTDVYEKKAWYLAGAHVRWIDIFIGFAIMYNNLIPLALYVSLELIKFAQFLMLQDIEMYDPVSDTPMVSNTQNIYENLGQVNYIFSDKTGTLTENVMRFRKMSVAGTAWAHSDGGLDGHQNSGTTMASRQVTNPGRDNSIQIHSPDTPAASRKQLSTDELLQSIQRNPSSIFAQKVSFFLLSLGICHTGFPETQKNGEIGFQAASPDELALLEAARDLGYAVTDRNSRSITLKTGSNVRETYEVLDVIEFSSKRKRMSIIVRCPNGRIVIFCKGADSVILSKCKLSSVALQAASRIERVHSQRISMEVEEAIVRKESRNSMQRPSLSLSVPGVNRRSSSFDRTGDLQQPRPSFHRPSLNLRPSMSRRSTSYEITRLNSVALDPLQSDLAALNSRGQSIDNDGFRNSLGLPRRSMGRDPSGFLTPPGQASATQKDYFSSRTDTDAVEFEHCLQHVHDFACEGLRTLVYGYRFIDEEEYTAWKKVYHSATTSLTGRQELIEAAAEVIEQNFEIAGATGIEDKLQIGVPETIDKLQRADIQIWMLTGDKRETAINIAQSARICKSYSHLITLDCANATVDIHQQITTALQELADGEIPHSVVIIDGQTLNEIESDMTTATKFYELLIKTDSVICCRASPSQKAAIVKNIRQKVKGSITLAIGDGGNDIAMIQEAHVGVGISGKEGLQAARVADYSIAQFRFLQRLLLVHGHWNYIRTAKFILLTFWKEMLFYSIQILYQRWNGYTGTSLFESASLTVWNTLFTSLPVMIPGIFEQDLSAATLLAVPELYGYGQRNQGFNMRKYTYWMIMAGSEAVIIYFLIYYLYGTVSMTKDQSLFALGDLGFSVAVVFINVKLLVLQYHYKTWIPIFCCLLTIWGWWIWNILLSYIYAKSPGPYAVYHSFMEIFGRDIRWWAVLGIVLGVVICIEIVVDTLIIWGWPGEIQVWQEVEREEARKGRVVGERREEVEGM